MRPQVPAPEGDCLQVCGGNSIYICCDELIHKQSVGACHNHGLVDIYTRMRLQRLEAGQSASGLRGPHPAGGLRDVQAADISRQDLRHLLRHP